MFAILRGVLNFKMQNGAIIFENIYIDEENIWFTDFDYNALYKINKKNKCVELIGIFPEEKIIQRSLYTSMVIYENKIYFTPYSAREIGVYDIEKNIFEKIKIDLPHKNNYLEWKNGKFLKSIVLKDKIYFIPYYYPGILCYEVKTGKFFCFDDWVDVIERKRASKWGYFIDVEVVGNRLILPCACSDAVVIFDSSTGNSKVIFTLPTNYQCKYCGIFNISNLFYLISADGTIYKRKLDKEQEEIIQIKLPVSEIDEIAFYPVQYMDGYIYMFPYKKNKGIKINVKTDFVEEESLLDVKEKLFTDTSLYLTCVADNKKLYATFMPNKKIIEFDVLNKKKQEIKLFLSERDKNIIQEKIKHEIYDKISHEYIMEVNEKYLNILINKLKEDKNLKKQEFDTRNLNKGMEIYSTLNKTLV